MRMLIAVLALACLAGCHSTAAPYDSGCAGNPQIKTCPVGSFGGGQGGE